MKSIKSYIKQQTLAAPLAAFRILFGLLMFGSIVRFWINGWIEKLYIEPQFHFHYLGFEMIDVPGGWTYLLFALCGVAAFFMAIGYKYHFSSLLFFLSITYIELMDKTTYLNHYYFISVLSFILLFLPANRYFSVDAYQNSELRTQFIPRWNIDIIKLMLGIVYFYAGIAKLNADWMLDALPLSIWLPSHIDLPIIGSFLDKRWVHYLFSWSGAIYDIVIPFLLLIPRTRILAFGLVVVFHVLTRILFPIGVFPFVMIFSTLIFFDASFHQNWLNRIAKLLRIDASIFDNSKEYLSEFNAGRTMILGFIMFLQIVLPWRYLLYSGNIFWNEEGYRFSWRVMLMEKTGYAQFKVVDGETGKWFYVQNSDFLTPLQEKQMSTQADFIVEYAAYLGKHFESQGHQNLEIYVESYAALNGRSHQQFIDPTIDLLTIENNLYHRDYIIPLKDE